MIRFVRPLGLSLVLALAATNAAAQADHLQCFKIKDGLAKAQYLADITPDDLTFPAAAGCTIKAPAKLLCVDAVKSNVTPPPPGAAPGAAAQKYLCYKAKCPKNQPTASLDDQFGTHAIEVKATSLVCAPVPEAVATCSDATLNGAETDVDCGGGSCPACEPGDNCGVGSDCSTSVCQTGVCQAALCSDGVQNGSETDVDCGGSCASCGDGSSCATGGDCTSGICQGNVCQSLLADGAACSNGAECMSSLCVDGFCCDTACDGTCQACSLARNGTADGVCGFITAATDPDNECVAGSCDGAGACQP